MVQRASGGCPSQLRNGRVSEGSPSRHPYAIGYAPSIPCPPVRSARAAAAGGLQAVASVAASTKAMTRCVSSTGCKPCPSGAVRSEERIAKSVADGDDVLTHARRRSDRDAEGRQVTAQIISDRMFRNTLALAAVMCCLQGCGGRGSSDASAQSAAGTPGAVTQAAAPTHPAGALDRCSLLTESEVRDAIGSHGDGSSSLENEYGLQSCRWVATTTQKAGGADWHDTIEVAVFDGDRTAWARQQANGDALDGFGAGATYDASYGKLWFACGQGGFCMVKARTASGTNREQTARRMALLIRDRVH
jgi:hypothetical protein